MSEYIKDHDAWNERAKALDRAIFKGYCHEREIWWCALGANIGSEQDGKNEGFERPVIILKKINDKLLLVMPLTSKTVPDRYRIRITSAPEASQAILSQIRTVSNKRLLKEIGFLKTDEFNIILAKTALWILSSIQSKTPSGDGVLPDPTTVTE